ncbi:serine/threonine-protein kinase [Catenuloplanes nepalensis]|uniref:non-specific serine/threonine protein kinase n=1 Tax=Catenuloplanes nepalensis TaxID=587533 RepID=A0ABT9N1G4_9ACTN|nr:serine/threonine-protein kinase [Catenuloplanes nepalensis]MDP9797540.1 serine/threonine-protein kinase [Catenuloplanes nepalensis]
MPSLHPGGLLARRYRIIDRIGAGGMSVIWRAHDEVLDRTVALKVLAASLAADTRFRSLVRQEARAAAAFVHPHVTAVHDYGEEIDPDGTVTAFVVMELLHGEVLEARLSQGPLDSEHAVRVCAEVAEALAAAHRLGIVHRDVTPANVMLTALGAKVLDFGIATHVGAPDEDEEGDTFGTPAYVAPERLDGTPAQPATDVYSLGVLLYETVTGRVPYPAETWDDLTVALAGSAAPPVDALPDDVAEICLRCLDRDPRARPTAHQVAASLRGLLPVPVRPRGRRRVALPAAGALMAVAVVSAALVAGTLLRPPAQLAAPHPPADAATPAPAGSPSYVSPSAVPVPVPASATAPVPTVREAMAALGHILDDGVARGEITADAGQDLRNLVRNLEANLAAGGALDLASQVRNLHVKVGDRLREGKISAEYATELGAALDRLATAV